MTVNFNVTYNGVFYPKNTEIPIESLDALYGKTVSVKIVAPTIKEEPKVEVETKVENNVSDKKYTKTEINRLSTKELRELAKTVGINGDEFVGSELKSMLIEKLV